MKPLRFKLAGLITIHVVENYRKVAIAFQKTRFINHALAVLQIIPAGRCVAVNILFDFTLVCRRQHLILGQKHKRIAAIDFIQVIEPAFDRIGRKHDRQR